MDNISDVTMTKITESNFIKPRRMFYTQNGIKKTWDVLDAHDSASILIHNTSRHVFVFVRQFRPPVYLARARDLGLCEDGVLAWKNLPGSEGVTYELCGGLIDKNISVAETASQELLEECGYKVDADRLERISSFKNGVGIFSATHTVFYAEVTDAMKVGAGGGNPHEGELIELVEIPVKDCVQFALDENKVKPVTVSFALMWFHTYKAST